MVCLVSQAAQHFGDSPAIVDQFRTLTYQQYNVLVANAAARLQEIGIGQSNRVGIVLPNGTDHIVLLMALIRIGAVACPISSRLPMITVESCLHKVDASYLVTDNEALKFASCRTIVSQEITRYAGISSFAESNLSLDQPAIIIFTSGSSGESKAVFLSLGNLYFNALGSNQNIPFGLGQSWLLSLPLYHVGGLGILFRALIGGGAVIIDSSESDLYEKIMRHSVTHLSLVSTQLYRLLSSSDQQQLFAKRLTAVLLGGSAMPSDLIRRSITCGLPIHTSYGLTEMASQVTTTALSTPVEKLYTSGRLLLHRQLRLAPSGEIELRGETRFAGYVEKQKLVMPFDSDGWFRSGDIGALDTDNYLTVIGRADTMFISGGENIYPEEIEKAMYSLDGIVETIVVPVPDREYGFRPCAFVRTTKSVCFNADSIREQLREHLPGFKLPDRIFAWPSGVEYAGFKPDRASLRLLAERLCAQHH